jgi:hypothetical protein
MFSVNALSGTTTLSRKNIHFDLDASDNDIYEEFKKVFLALSKDFVLDFIPEIYAKLTKEEKKHPRSESTNDTGVAQKILRE